MTSPSPGSLSSPRALAAWALVLYVAVAEFFAFLTWVVPSDLNSGTFALRSALASNNFLDFVTMALPILAVLITAKIAPSQSNSRIVATIALAEYAVAVLFGLITLLIGLGSVFDLNTSFNRYGAQTPSPSGLGGTAFLIEGLLAVAVVAAAGFITFKIFTELGGKLQMPASGGGHQQPYPAQPGQYPPPQQPQYPPQAGQPQYPPQPGQYPGAQ